MQQAKRDVYRLVEIDHLERREPLVVVKRNHDIEFAAQLAPEQRVTGFATREPGMRAAQFTEDRIDNVALLKAEQTGLARMRIEPAYADARTGWRGR